jgi:serine/threonine protein kinase
MKAIKKVDIITIKNHWKDLHANEVRKPTDDDLKPYYKGFFNEINNMKILQGKNNQNQNTVIFYEYFNTKESFAYIMELCDGNLLHYIEKNKKDKNLNIEEIKNILIQLNNSFKIMHEKKILHRAIKPENILYKKDNNSKIIFKLKLTDNCCLLKDSSKIEMSNIILYNNLCISAPEVLKGEKFKEESDLWSLGVLIYYLKFNKYPFIGNNKDEILIQIKDVKLEETNNKVFDDLVKKLLTVNSNKRMSWRTYFDHPFFR